MLNFKTLTAVAALATAVSLGTAGSSFAQNWGSGGGGAASGGGGAAVGGGGGRGGGAPAMGGGGGGPAMGGAGLGARGNVFSGAVRGGMGGGGPVMGGGPRGGGSFTGGPRYGGGYGRGGWQGGGWHGHRHWRGGGYWPGAYAGAFGFGSSYYYNDPYAYDYGYYDEPAVAVVPGGGDRDDAYCSQRFKSYDPASGTYLGYDGKRHPCP